jgi:hypothetical protein
MYCTEAPLSDLCCVFTEEACVHIAGLGIRAGLYHHIHDYIPNDHNVFEKISTNLNHHLCN